MHPLTKESDRNRFERECKVMGRLSSHDGVVTVYSAGYTTDNKPKPDNILVHSDHARLTDFGIAHLRDSTGSTSRNITASWLHTAPETFDNKRDERSDIYSTASTLFSLIAGRAPFENPGDESLNPLMRRLLEQEPPRLGPSRVPAALDDYLQRCLAKDPNARPQTAQALADGLKLLVDTGGTQAPTIAPPSSRATQWAPPGMRTPVPPPGAIPGQLPANPTTEVHQPPVIAPPGSFTPPSSPPSSNATPPRPDGPNADSPASWARPAPVDLAVDDGGTGRGPKVAILGVIAAAFLLIGGLSYAAIRIVQDSDGEVASPSQAGSADGSDGSDPVETADALPTVEPEAPATQEGSESEVDESATEEPDRPTAPLPAGDAASIDELEAHWAENRAAIVEVLSSDAFGVDDKNDLER